MQEYVATDTVTVYGVAITMEERDNFLNLNSLVYSRIYKPMLMRRTGPSPINTYAYSFSIIDSVTLYRSHPRFCWFLYENDDTCSNKNPMTVPCYEFYFDTPAKINRMTDTFYVGRYKPISMDVDIYEFGGEYSSSIPSTIYESGLGYEGMGLDFFFHCNGYQDRKWGVFFPIIGFRCGPVKQYWLEEYGGHYAIVRWLSFDDSTMYNLRLMGEDGSDTTVATTDTVYTFNWLSDSVRYNVTLRKQCHYATSNYDTTVCSEWSAPIFFGTTILDTVWRTVTVGSNNPNMGTVSGNGVYADSSTVMLTATPFYGYEFDAWADGDSTNPRQVLVVSDTAFTAIFREVEDTTAGIMHPQTIDFMLQPNPARGTVQIMLPTTAQGARLSLCDMAGRELESRIVAGTYEEWDISGLPTGAYIVKLATAQGTTTRRLLVENP